MNTGYGKKEHTVCAVINLEAIQPHGGDCLSPARYYHLADTVTESSKDCNSIRSSQLIPDDEGHGTTGKFNEHGPIAKLNLLLKK